MLKQMVTGVLLVLRRMVNGRTQASMGQTPQAQPGVNNTSAPTRGGKRKSQVAQVQRQSKPVAQKPKRKPKAAQSTTAASSRKAKPKPVRQAAKASGATGKQPATRAPRTRQHAK